MLPTDMTAKGRVRTGGIPQYGEKNPMSKLTNESVLRIREMAASGLEASVEIAALVGVQRRQIGRILDGTRWGHI